MATKPVTMGIIGYGHFLRTNFVLHLKECDALDIVGVYNRGEERRRQAEQDGYWTTGDLDELLAMPNLESVLIGTSNAAHREQAIRAAAAGKHVLCEKPLALTMEDMDAMVEAVESAGVINHVNHPSPYTDGFVKFRALCEAHVGRIHHFWKRSTRAYGTWVQGARHGAVANPAESGGWTFHHFCHQLNDAFILLNSRAVRVYHLAQKSCDAAPSEEYVNSLVTFENGATAFLSDSTSVGPFTDMGVQGDGADLRLLNRELTLVKPGPEDSYDRPGNRKGIIETFEVEDTGKNLVAVGHRFAQAVRGGKNELIPFRMVRDQYKTLVAMSESARTGRAVDVAN